MNTGEKERNPGVGCDVKVGVGCGVRVGDGAGRSVPTGAGIPSACGVFALQPESRISMIISHRARFFRIVTPSLFPSIGTVI